MLWNNHKELEGRHAFLGASNFRWITWNDQEFEQHYYNQYATQAGTVIHQLAHDCIVARMHLTKHDKRLIDMTLFKAYIPYDAYDSEYALETLIPYVNDAIGFHMTPELVLYYNDSCFGTTDAISFDEKERMLRIHDLKTGSLPAHFEQLLIYSSLFCLEYHKNPEQIKVELRIYQANEFQALVPEPKEIQKMMDAIVFRSGTIKTYMERDR